MASLIREAVFDFGKNYILLIPVPLLNVFQMFFFCDSIVVQDVLKLIINPFHILPAIRGFFCFLLNKLLSGLDCKQAVIVYH